MTSTEEELLAEAKRRYPIGTKFRCVNGNCHGKAVADDIWEVSNYGKASMKTHGIHSGNGWILLHGKWAEIVELPEPKIVNDYEIY